jgi:hypothetical protein
MVRFKTKPQRSLKKEEQSDPNPKHSILIVNTNKSQNERKEVKEPSPKAVEKINNEKPDELNKHPLEDLEGVPKLTDLQRMITSAILIHGEPCPFDKMAEFISQRWRGLRIRRRDGTPYATDYRRAIKANLRLNPNQIALFKRDPLDKDMWFLVRTLEEAMSLSKSDGRTITKRSPIDHDDESNIVDSEMIDEDGLSDQPESASRSEDDFQSDSNNAFKPETEQQNVSNTNIVNFNSEPITQQYTSWGKKDIEEKREEDYIELTELQTLVSTGIKNIGQYATVDQIYEYVSPLWGTVRGPNKQPKTTDCRRAIITCLSKTSFLQLFVRNPTEYASWGLGVDHPWIKKLRLEQSPNSNINQNTNMKSIN